MATGCTENFVKFGYMVFKICSYTDPQIHKHTHHNSSQTLHIAMYNRHRKT